MNVYMAGPIFTEGQRYDMNRIDDIVRSVGGVQTFLPHRDGGVFGLSSYDPQWIYTRDCEAIENCNFMVACIDGLEVDAGTAVEIGMAHAKGIPVILYKADSRDKFENLMVTKGDTMPIMRDLDSLKEFVIQTIDALKPE